MHRLMMICAVCLMGCETTVEYIEVRPDVPPDLLKPVEISDRQAETYRGLAVLGTGHLTSAQKANAKIEALAAIVGPQ